MIKVLEERQREGEVEKRNKDLRNLKKLMS